VQVASEAVSKLSPSRATARAAGHLRGQRIGRAVRQRSAGAWTVVVARPLPVLEPPGRGTSVRPVRYVVPRRRPTGSRQSASVRPRNRILKRLPPAADAAAVGHGADAVSAGPSLLIDPLHVPSRPEQPTVDKLKHSFYTVDDEKKFDRYLRCW